MKKKMVLLSLIVATILALSACGSAPKSNKQYNEAEQPAETTSASLDELKPEPGAELVYWDMKDSYTDLLALEFEKKYGVKVTVEDVKFWETLGRLGTDGPAGTGADVVVAGADQLGPAVKSGLVLPNDYFEEETKEITVKSAVDAATIDGILYGYPRNIESYMIYVNKELVKNTKLETWDDVKAFAKQFNDIPNNKYGFLYEPNSMLYNYSFMAGYGAYIFGKNGTDKNDIGLNNEGAVKGMEFFRSLKEIFPVEITDLTEDIKVSLWEQGKAAMIIDGIWNAAKYKKLPFEVGVIQLPKMPGGIDPVPYASVPAYFVSSYSKYPNAAKLFAHFATTKEMQLKNYEIRGVLPAYQGIENDEKLKEDEFIQAFSKHVKDAQMIPSIQEVEFFFQSMPPVLEQIWKGSDIKKTLDKAVADMKSNIEADH
ncbi:sugar ABC transporter substrate-binding protein [Paenibacillus wynnii]|uniref:sugar ABC transporter substrate-binding protein n=1 Tax=Paenibacillus wynnii TaxID=268407 RepID=UPI002793CB44|nr:maltose ABC transporter substrate-binding protein [Paenibacillus wynnii]MDQ0194892.1 arabinogalactan oligomer/maltooligosaccharide transport system substrate-binding protein [Paenibacillus wynnii]